MEMSDITITSMLSREYPPCIDSATISGKTEGSGVKVSVIKFNITELIKLKEKKVRNVLVQPGLS